MPSLTLKHLLIAVAFVISMLATGSAHPATPPHWKDTGFSINAAGMGLAGILNEFGMTYGVRVANSVQSSVVSKGRLQASSGTEFLDRLALVHKFRWFVYNDTLYVAPLNDTTSARIEVGEDAVTDAKAALTGVGLFDPRFGWGEIADEGVVIVSGPQQYVRLVREILQPAGKKPEPRDRQLMVFRLKYASATDRTINVRSNSAVIPGIRTILSNLLQPESQPRESTGALAAYSRKRFGASGPLPANPRALMTGLAAGSESMKSQGARQSSVAHDDQDEDNPRRRNRAVRPEPVRIEADPSLNAVLIYDVASKRPMYQQLIAELDVEPQQVEIEALIVDIDRSKLSQLGAEWGVGHGNTTAIVNGTNAVSAGAGLPIPGSTLLIRNLASFYVRLHALEGSGEARVLAKPTVLTLENAAAVLDLSQSAYVPLVGERVADLADITAGTMLKVVPRIVRDGGNVRVRMDIEIEDGAISQGDTVNRTGVTRSTINTQALIAPQQTLLIGGYHSAARTRNRDKIPVLGDVPVLGTLFQNNSDSVSNRERLFLITPRLVGAAGMPAPERSHLDAESRTLPLSGEISGDKKAEPAAAGG